MGLFYYSLSLTNCKAAKVTNTAGKCRGTLVTFDDITQLEEKNFEPNDLVEKLQLANGEIHVKSQELETLANCDPLTLCLNRLSLALSFDSHVKVIEKKADKIAGTTYVISTFSLSSLRKDTSLSIAKYAMEPVGKRLTLI